MKKPPPDGIHILVVDDEEQVLSFLADCLGHLGYPVEPVSRGSVAIERIEQNHYDIMFLDLRMPEMDGLDVLNRVREIDESLSAPRAQRPFTTSWRRSTRSPRAPSGSRGS